MVGHRERHTLTHRINNSRQVLLPRGYIFKENSVFEILTLVQNIIDRKGLNQPLAHTHIVNTLAVGNNITSLRATILYLDVEQLLHSIGVAVELTLRKLLATPKMRLEAMLYLFERNRSTIVYGCNKPHIAVDKSCGTHNGLKF